MVLSAPYLTAKEIQRRYEAMVWGALISKSSFSSLPGTKKRKRHNNNINWLINHCMLPHRFVIPIHSA